ncbi:HeH/LEM domain-containing protein [Acinetobacter brisouii]|uniref:HeH/LEM domain-containing protein n=1 Tax=Acinetobacter brisouii TaxID=396323 RepID=UPI0035B0052F
MGIFDFLKNIGKKEVAQNKEEKPIIHSMPTIKPDDEIYDCYDEVFKVMIADISGISSNEAKEIQALIKRSDGGFLNMSGYHSIVWEKYFKGREWKWNEYEEWNTIFQKKGKFPVSFPIRKEFSPATSEDALSQLKVVELKTLCKEHSIEIPTKSKKADLVELLKSVKGITNSALVSDKIEEINNKFNYGLYSLLMRTINFRGKNLYDQRRAERLGVKKYKILYVIEEDKELVDMALKMKPNALHPLFPSDMSQRQVVIDFDDM